MNKDEILVPILTAINDLREEVRENRREIRKNTEKIDENRNCIMSLDKRTDSLEKKMISMEKRMTSVEERMTSIEKRMESHENDSKRDRKEILEILYSYEQVTNKQYEENKKRIDKLEEKIEMISA